MVYPYNGVLFRQAPAVRGAKPSLCHAPPAAKVACRGVILPSCRSSPVVDLPPHQTWTAGQRPGGWARAGLRYWPQSDRDPAAENRQLGASFSAFSTRDQHRQGEGLLGPWMETDLVCRTQRLSLGLLLGYSSAPAGSGRPLSGLRAPTRASWGGGLTWLRPPHLKPQGCPGMTAPPRPPYTLHAAPVARRGLESSVRTAANSF